MSNKMYMIADKGPYYYDSEKTVAGQTPFSYKSAGIISFLAGSPSTITDSLNGFVGAGFVAGEVIYVRGSSSNNRLFHITNVSAGTLTIHQALSCATEAGPIGAVELHAIPLASISAEDMTIGAISVNRIEDADGDTGVEVEKGSDDDTIRFEAGGTYAGTVTDDGLALEAGARVKEFSADGTMSGNALTVVPTEFAVKKYVDDNIHDRQHAITSTSDHTSTATAGQVLKADANGLPIDATNTDAEVSDAVTKAHTRLHDIDSSDDHNSPSGTEDNIVLYDSNGYPIKDSDVNIDTVGTTGHIITSDTTVENTDSETTIYSADCDCSGLAVGALTELHVCGVISNDSASDDITIKIKIGLTTLQTFKPAIGNISSKEWHVHSHITFRSIGATGSVAWGGSIYIDGTEDYGNNRAVTVDTTGSNTVSITVQWDNAKAANQITAYQGWVTVKNKG